MRVAVYTIVKDEEQFISRWAESCRDADVRLVVDTGSVDGTLAAALKAGCDVRKIRVDPWRFDVARNMALDLVPDDVDMCVSLDADEVLTAGWREALEQMSPAVTRPRYKYVWSWKPDGTEGLVYSGDKIHARHGYRWTHPVHEVLTPTGVEVQEFVGLEIHHHPDPSKSRSQYLPLLELAVSERPDDDRNRFYLGRELMFNGRPDEAVTHLKRHLELSSWPAERATSMRYLSRLTGDRESWLLRACGETPDRREPWVELARFYYERRWWDQCYAACTRALVITVKPLEYLCEEEAWGALPHDLASVSAWYSGRRGVALKHGWDAISADPNDPRLRNNVDLMSAELRKASM
ncbi:MAG: tetratricopeptide repeat-containing glycosyltransferase [Ilumatobacteraceae bacterium]